MEKSLKGSKVSLDEVLQQLCRHIKENVVNDVDSSFADFAIETALLILRDIDMGAIHREKLDRICFYKTEESE